MATTARLLCVTIATRSSGGWPCPFSYSGLSHPKAWPWHLSNLCAPNCLPTHLTCHCGRISIQFPVAAGAGTWPRSSDSASCNPSPTPGQPLSVFVLLTWRKCQQHTQAAPLGWPLSGSGKACPSQPLCSPSCSLGLHQTSALRTDRPEAPPSLHCSLGPSRVTQHPRSQCENLVLSVGPALLLTPVSS